MKNSPAPESEASVPGSWLPVGQRVPARARRIQLGFRKGAVAARLGVSMERFEAMEAGRVEITPELLGRLSELMKVPVLYFFEDLLSAEAAGGEFRSRRRQRRGARGEPGRGLPPIGPREAAISARARDDAG